MGEKAYTLIVVPDQQAQVRRVRVRRRLLVQAAGACVVIAGLAVGAAIHYFQAARAADENKILREENTSLKKHLSAIRERVDHIGSTLDRVERVDQKLRALTLLADPQRNLAMGPTESEPGTRVPSTNETRITSLTPADNPKALVSRLDKLFAEATREEQSLQELHGYYQDQKSYLASIPSIWPARGYLSSDFGLRSDPYTAIRTLHAGLDIASEQGKEVMAPSDGTVIFSGNEGGYGNVLVIDHGYGIKTRYGHLMQILVKQGDHIHRGQAVARIGNTGRSTGPHLHYEVRVEGRATNPKKFILED